MSCYDAPLSLEIRLFPTGDLAVSNTILFNANVGLGFYVYFRRHLHRVNPWERVEFSVLCSTLFNFGSLLAAVLIKALFPARSPTWLKSLTATVLSGYLLSRGAKYMGLLDTRTGRGASGVSPARSVLSRRHTAVIPSGDVTPPQAPPTSGPAHSTSELLHLDTTTTSPESARHLEYSPMTPSGTEHSEVMTSSEFGGVEDSEGVTDSRRQNYRYLHSYALNNLNFPKKDAILRRTTMNQNPNSQNPGKRIQKATTTTSGFRRPSSSEVAISFVTPEPSLKNQDYGIYTPPPSRQENQKTKSRRRRAPESRIPRIQKIRKNELDDVDRVIDLIQWHAPIAMIPLAVGCWVTGTVPLVGATWRLIFA
ncbi:hypothetical protein GCK72_015946 [Caenorhabditis remanei]|uniref:Uncharacterized protein n=1 Tax=Caenorhabditis remanei TaxID=31234 RepID=A0A6A5GXV2_CAERE|nr:hypothetical protein GCK72_015946 [Caenorhabditis remanei]KAF1759479.1 hypothetical protein GCK72_015946 [Caenorhabditis remanei]